MIVNNRRSPETDVENVFNLVRQGQTDCAIAAHYGVTCDRISKIKAGINNKSYAKWFSEKFNKRHAR